MMVRNRRKGLREGERRNRMKKEIEEERQEVKSVDRRRKKRGK
jgi:hypothetical protein